MAPRKRIQSATKLLGAQNSETRAALIGAVRELMVEEGYAAVTARKLADRLGMRHQVVFYYFETIDDLLLAVFRQAAEEGLATLARRLEAEQPLREMWDHLSDPRLTRIIGEFMALANHSPAIRSEIARYNREARQLEAEALSRHLQARGLPQRMSPVLISFLMTAIARVLAAEADLGVDAARDEVETFIETVLARFEETGESFEPATGLVEHA